MIARNILTAFTAGTLAVAACVAIAPPTSAQGIPRRDDAPKPLSPADSAAHFRLPADLRIELVASEPLVRDPTAVAWDERGRLFVSEIHGYNLEGHLDIQELNKTGELDKEIRRIPASPEAKRAADKETYGTVKLLHDSNGDGHMDRADVWADRLPPCHGMIAARGGMIAICRTEIVYLADRDGDGRAEVRETLFSGFGETTLERSINNPRPGLDNWIYVAGANAGGTITGPNLEEPVEIGATDFRFRPDGSAIEPVTGRSGTFGMAMTDWGDRFLVSTGSNALYATPLPYRYLARNPFVPSPDGNANGSTYNRVYPASQPHPWRLERGRQEVWQKFYGAQEATPNGYFTSACGPMFYTADALPDTYHGNHFCCEPSQNLVHRSLIERNGLRFTARRAAGEEESEFLSSSDGWFRPINLMTGPDGAIYVVDMYREIIEDYSAIPRYLQQQFGLVEGKDHGRIWRIRGKDHRSLLSVDMAGASPARLIETLSSNNAMLRHTAQRLLIERGERGERGERSDRAGVAELKDLVRRGKTPQARLHALWTLAGLDALTEPVLQRALSDFHFAIRRHALQLCEAWLDRSPSLLQKVVSLADDASVPVRLQLAMTLGTTDQPAAIAALGQLAETDGDDEWVRAAILSSVPRSADRLLAQLIGDGRMAGNSRHLVGPLASIVGARRDKDEIERLLVAVSALEGEHGVEFQTESLSGFVEGLRRGQAVAAETPATVRAIGQLLSAPSQELRARSFEIARLLNLAEFPEMRAAFEDAARVAVDRGQPLSARQSAMNLLKPAPYPLLAATAKALLDSRENPDLQLAAVESLAASDDSRVGTELLADFSGFTPIVQSAVLEAVFSRSNRLSALVDAIERGSISPQSLDSLYRVMLLEHADADIRKRVTKHLSPDLAKPDRELFERYRDALSGPRDVGQGRKVFEGVCAKCHRLEDRGFQVGPDLSVANNRPDEVLLVDILQPSSRITAGYRSYTVVDSNGRIFTGVLTSETATSVTLRAAGDTPPGEPQATPAAEQTILRRDIERMKSSGQSLMPDNLHKEIPPRDMANLIAYLRDSLGPAVPVTVSLFDDDPDFATQLTRGGGTASLATDDAFAGQACLKITPFQRHNPRIPGWEYPIAENPKPGEYRYLRLAWKSKGAGGVMVELAAGGHWPSADKPVRRYYSGENTTDWQATEVSPRLPTEWTVVTRDLWKDCGAFTLTGIAPTAMGGEVLFDRIELLRTLDTLDAPDSASGRRE